MSGRRGLALAAGLISFVPPALAGPMMPAGASPESGLAGIWRVIEAPPAPWTRPRALGKRDAPLLEYAVEFAERELKGSDPLRCNDAKYSSGVTYRSEAFNGHLAQNAAQAKKLDLDDSQYTTFRVYCGGTQRDFYIDDSANLVMAEGDRLYARTADWPRPVGSFRRLQRTELRLYAAEDHRRAVDLPRCGLVAVRP